MINTHLLIRKSSLKSGSSSSEEESRRRQKKRKRARDDSTSSSSSSDSSGKDSRHKRSHRKGHKRKRKKKQEKRRKYDDSSSDDSSSYEKYRRRKKHRRKHHSKQKRKSKKPPSEKESRETSQVTQATNKDGDSGVVTEATIKMEPVAGKQPQQQFSPLPPQHEEAKLARAKSMVPMSREQYEAQQSVIREVYDEESGRTRLVRGTGEIIERIVSRSDHERINQQATRGDGSSYSRHIFSASQDRRRR